MEDPALHLRAHRLFDLDRLSRRALLRAGATVALTGALAALLLPARGWAALPYEEVADGIFVRFGVQEEVTAANCGAIANIGFIVGDSSVAVVDTGSTRNQGLALREAIARTTDKPVSHVIATHVHFDHCFGHSAFADLPVRYVGHRNLSRALAERGAYYMQLLEETCSDVAGTMVVPPDEPVADVLDIDLGNRPLRLEAWPTAHTNTDLTVFDVKTGSLWTGDLLFDGRLPTLDGSITGWLQVTDDLLPAEVQRVIPGHGPVSDGHAALAAQRGYLESLRDDVRRAIGENLDIPQALERLGRQDLAAWAVIENEHGRNIVSAYKELEWE